MAQRIRMGGYESQNYTFSKHGYGVNKENTLKCSVQENNLK